MKGLSTTQAAAALQKFGPNVLPKKRGFPALAIFTSQLKNPFSLILIAAVLLAFFTGDKIDAFLIGAILSLNTILGFWQEFKASKELEALKSFEAYTSRVLRDGKEVEIPSPEIVPGDLVILEAGDKIPADGKVFESYSLSVNESVLTGESLSVMKSIKEEDNMLFFGTTVVSGRGKFEVLKTGTATRFGEIAQSLAEVEDEKTPLEKSLSKLIKAVSIAVLATSALIFIIRFLQGFEITEVFLTSIALMVAAVPEGLPAVVTIVLALGVHKMYQKKALVRKMVAVESLGSATVILSDKTGTLTKNEMRVQEVKIHLRGEQELLKCAVVCNSASLVLKENHGGFDILGDTTEGALLIWAKDQGKDVELMRSEGKLLEEIPFSLESRKMTVIWEEGKRKTTFTKGSPEVILKEVKLTSRELGYWNSEYQKMASSGLRVLGFSKGSEFLGFIGIADQIREEAKEAIRIAKKAGIKVAMVTGDSELTAKSVAEKLGLLEMGDEVLTGLQLKEMSDEKLRERVDKISVYARITPEDKHRLVKIYQSKGEVVAVTGDGVNDSLALKGAQIGVSMGITGSDVAREASDIILLDDNFATLVSAIEEGRLIYNNILKVIKFLLTTNLSEVLLIAIASFLALPSPLLPTQILWINFVSDGLPALFLGFDNASPNIMRNVPKKDHSIMEASMIRYIVAGGVTIALICFLIFYVINSYFGLQSARAVTFTLIVVLQLLIPFIIRKHHSIFSNKKLLGSVMLMLLLQALIMTVPQLKVLFGIE